jgi:hypothetical protein
VLTINRVQDLSDYNKQQDFFQNIVYAGLGNALNDLIRGR